MHKKRPWPKLKAFLLLVPSNLPTLNPSSFLSQLNMVYNPYAKQSAKRPRPEHWNEPASRPPPSSSHNDQNIVPNHPPNNMASSVAAPQQIQSQRVARVLKKHGIVAGGQPPQGRSTSSSLANNAYQPNPTGTKPTQLVNNVYKPSNQLTGVYSERVCTYDSNESTMNHSSGVQPTISHRSSTTNTTANATSNIPQSLRTSTTAHGPRSLKPPPYLPNPNNHKRPTDSLQNNQSQLLQKSHAVQNLYTNKPPSGVHQMVRPIANIPPSSTSTALTNNSLYSSNNNEISCGSTSIINGMNQSQQQSQKNLSVPNNTTNPNVAVMQQASPIDPYAKNQNPSSTVIANDDSWASSKVNTTEGRGQNTHKSQTINPYCKTSSTITNTQRHVIASGISNQSIQRDAPVPSTQPSHRNGSSNVINEQTTRSIKSTPANPYLKSAGSASATNGYSAGTTNSQSNNFSTTANTLIQSQPTSSLSHRAENTSQGALSCAPERRSNPNQGQSQSAVLKDTSNTGEVVPVNAYRQNRSSQELPGVSNQHNPLVSIEHGAKAAGVKPSMPQPMKNAQAKGPPGSLASIRPPSWKANVTDPQKVENESITASKLELPGESILPKELQYSPDRMKPIKDEYRQKLVNNANLSKPLLNGCTLYSHQKRAILQGLMKRRMVLALDMGLGKTLIGCVWSKSFKLSYDCLKIFVVCPVSLKEEWKRTAENFTGLEVEDFNGKAKEDSQDLRICSWAKVPKAVDKSVVHYVVVFDEAHSMQSMQAARTKDALKFVDNKRYDHVYLMFPLGVHNRMSLTASVDAWACFCCQELL